jgi:hypothetical protein
MPLTDLDSQLRNARLAAYAEARAGWPVPLAGATYWAGLAWLGTVTDEANWSLIAAIFSGAIFPIAVAYAALFRNPFMKVKVPDQGVVFMAMGAMLLFWPMAVAAMWNYNALTPLILAIGMSGHWPVFGWSYGRPAPFLGHAIVRAIAAFGIWQYMPDGRFTVLPAAVAVIYLVTVLVLYLDSGRVAARLRPA